MNKKKNREASQIIATSPLQSQLLTETGLPARTADMRWNRRVQIRGQMVLESLAMNEPPIEYAGMSEHPADFVPAWSLGKLIQIAGGVPNLDRPDLIIACLVNLICEQLENGGDLFTI